MYVLCSVLSLLTYLPPVRIILVANLHNVPSLEGQSQSLARDLIVKTTIVVEVGTHIFLCVCVWGGGDDIKMGESCFPPLILVSRLPPSPVSMQWW